MARALALIALTGFAADASWSDSPVREPAPAPALPDALSAGWKGQARCVLLSENAARRMLRCSFPPGTGHERHFHPAHFGYALSGGTMRITDANGTRTARIETGSHFSSPGIAWHEGVNIGRTTVSYLMVEEKAIAGASH